MRRFARPFLNVLIVAGLVLAVWPVGQTLYGLWSQRSLASQWQSAPKSGTTKSSKRTTREHRKRHTSNEQKLVTLDPDSPAAGLPATKKKQAPWTLTKISIPDIELETFVVQGVDAPALRRGPGHDPNSSQPGKGNCVIAGHRNVYGSFFYRLNELMPGAEIHLENRHGKWTYIVSTVITSPATDLSVLEPPTGDLPPILTLITCTLPHSSDRVILRAGLEAEE